MNYSVEMIMTKPDCQAMINIATAERNVLVHKKSVQQFQHQNASATSVDVEAELAATSAELAALANILASLPESPTKDKLFINFKKVEYKKFQLEQRKGNYGVLALLEREYDIACVDKAITETDAFLADLATRFAEL